ncbi:hypothetical protein BgAZ_101200 [Babesia gibsoni]|uniref:Ubiquitin-related modifier 1 homolog n=1 Tax=Babesia gibsoni TaxID=33632 RepID=A0AAD8PF79_BABGI|nr:hypothetical protein BgAZ_101200 [Babesia gibsoni]
MAESACLCELVLDFAGGLEDLTINQNKLIKLTILDESVTVSQLIAYLRRSVFGAKRELFAHPPEVQGAETSIVKVEGDCPGELNKSEGSNVRAGVLVLVNDVDWELLGRGSHVLKGEANVSFISSLHGG